MRRVRLVRYDAVRGEMIESEVLFHAGDRRICNVVHDQASDVRNLLEVADAAQTGSGQCLQNVQTVLRHPWLSFLFIPIQTSTFRLGYLLSLRQQTIVSLRLLRLQLLHFLFLNLTKQRDHQNREVSVFHLHLSIRPIDNDHFVVKDVVILWEQNGCTPLRDRLVACWNGCCRYGSKLLCNSYSSIVTRVELGF